MTAAPQTVTTWYLQMLDASQLRRARVPEPEPLILRAEVPLPMLSRFLYTAVGGHWHWRDRLRWTYAQWMAWLDRPELQTWVLYQRGTPAGYVELERQAGGDVEIAYFGLMREFLGQGLGGHLLTVGIERAWDMGAVPASSARSAKHAPAQPHAPAPTAPDTGSRVRRVWVHTCSLDAPQALANYEARGMQRYREETKTVVLPDAPEGPWPGAFDEAPGPR